MDMTPKDPSQGRLLDHLLDDHVDLDRAFERVVAAESGSVDDKRILTATLPGDCLASQEVSLASLLASVLAEYEDIETLIEGFKEHEAASVSEDTEAIAVVSEAELADPAVLSQALGEFQGRDKFEYLFDTAKRSLDRLDIYELSQLPPADLVHALKSEHKLGTVEALVDFLRSLKTAADTFEALDMPTPHIREYLSHLYLMRDWREMARLVGLLEVAVTDMAEADNPTLDAQG